MPYVTSYASYDILIGIWLTEELIYGIG